MSISISKQCTDFSVNLKINPNHRILIHSLTRTIYSNEIFSKFSSSPYSFLRTQDYLLQSSTDSFYLGNKRISSSPFQRCLVCGTLFISSSPKEFLFPVPFVPHSCPHCIRNNLSPETFFPNNPLSLGILSSLAIDNSQVFWYSFPTFLRKYVPQTLLRLHKMSQEIVSITNELFTLTPDCEESFISLPEEISLTALRGYFQKEMKIMHTDLGFPLYDLVIESGFTHQQARIVTATKENSSSSGKGKIYSDELPVSKDVQAALDALQQDKKIKISDPTFRRSLYRGAKKLGITITATAQTDPSTAQQFWIFYIPKNPDGSTQLFEVIE